MLEVGPLTARRGSPVELEAQPVDGPKEEVEAEIWEVSHEDGWRLDLAIPRFSDGARDIRCIDYTDGTPIALHRLSHGLRMSIIDLGSGKSFAEMSRARVKKLEPPYHSTLVKATESELDDQSGCSVRNVIDGLGGEFGSREDLIGDGSRRRSYQCVVMANDHDEPAVIAYLLTRILPLLKATASL